MKNKLLLFALLLSCGYFVNAQQKFLWGSATTGGAYGFGTIVRCDTDGTNFQTVASFDSLNGSYPVGKMVMARNHKIYGITEFGTFDDSCCIFTYDPWCDSITVVYEFYLQQQYGGQPVAGLTAASNGKLYGTTLNFGANGYGVIFSLDPTTNTYTDLYDFTGYTGTQTGAELLQANDGKLYGLAQTGGTNNHAVLYSFDPSGDQFNVVHNFDTASFLQHTNAPTPALIQGVDNKIYGVLGLDDGTINFGGILFSYDINTTSYSDLHDFQRNEGFPAGGFIQAGNGKLYGTATRGINFCKIYSYDIAGAAFSTLMDFDSTLSYLPVGGFGLMGSEKLIGSMSAGGAYGQGQVFTYDFISNTYSDILDFDGTTTGTGPMCSFLEAVVQAPSGVVRVTNNNAGIYPNPASNLLHIQNVAPNTSYVLTNALGQIIQTGVMSDVQQTLDISQLPPGAYLLNNQRFVKQ